MPRDAVSRTANVERNGGHKWVKRNLYIIACNYHNVCSFFNLFFNYHLRNVSNLIVSSNVSDVKLIPEYSFSLQFVF